MCTCVQSETLAIDEEAGEAMKLISVIYKVTPPN